MFSTSITFKSNPMMIIKANLIILRIKDPKLDFFGKDISSKVRIPV
jgi:hypothetical protein